MIVEQVFSALIEEVRHAPAGERAHAIAVLANRFVSPRYRPAVVERLQAMVARDILMSGRDEPALRNMAQVSVFTSEHLLAWLEQLAHLIRNGATDGHGLGNLIDKRRAYIAQQISRDGASFSCVLPSASLPPPLTVCGL